MRMGPSSRSGVAIGRRVGTSATALALAAGALLAAPASAFPSTLGGACSQNQYVIDAGTATAASSGAFSFTESTLETGSGEIDNGAGKVLWSSTLKVTGPNTGSYGDQSPGNIGGAITAVISWAGGGRSMFVSTCVQEATTDSTESNDPFGGEMEMEAEGLIVGFPGLGFFPQKAVASLSVGPGDNGLTAKLGIELGSTCFEPLPWQPPDEFAVGAETGVTGSLSATNDLVGRWSFPNSFNPSNCTDSFAGD